MNRENRKYYLQNLVFIIGLIVLLTNDHYLKLEYSNWLTGKLSDFIGVLILPMVLTYLFPRSKKTNVILTGLFFIFWKSPVSQSFIDGYNQITLIKITRVVDYSDLVALCFLPISYFLLIKINEFERLKIKVKGLNPVILLLPTTLVLMATSPPAYYKYTYSDGELKCFKCTKTVKYGKSELLEILKKNNYAVSMDSLPIKEGYRFEYYWRDSTSNWMNNYPYYKIDRIIIGTDTLTHFQFALEKISDSKTKIWINGMNISKEIPDNKVERILTRYYRKLIKNHLQQSISENGA